MKNSFSLLSILLITAGLTVSCSGRRVGSDSSGEEQNKDQKIEHLSSSLSQAQSRIEELDAKVLALTDKLEAAQVTLDNISGGKNLKTEVLGSASSNSIPSPIVLEKVINKKTEDHTQAADAQSDSSPALALFNKAMGLFKNGKYSESVLVFNQFTEQHPENILAGSAQFHTGEAYFMMGEFKLALPEYEKVISTFPSSPRVASSLVRISQCQQKTGNKKLSSQTFVLAKETYKGNPSLELTDSVEVAKAPTQNTEIKQLPVLPMVPETKKTNNNEDAELDLIKE